MKTFKQFIEESNSTPLFKKDIKSGASMLAQSTPKDFNNDYEHSGGASILGHPVENHNHIAALGEVMRNPNYETFHHIYTKDGVVVGHSAISNHLPSKVAITKPEETEEEHLENLRGNMKRTGADGYWLLHNHPSGDPKPSIPDINATMFYEKNVHGFKGHVIVNHKTYSNMKPHDASWDRHTIHSIDQDKSYDLANKTKPHDSLGKVVDSPDKVAEIAKTFQNPNHATVMGITPKFRLAAAAHIPLHLLHSGDNKLKAQARLRKFIKQTGSGGNTMISVPHDDDLAPLSHLVYSGLATDIVSHSGKSIRLSGVHPKTGNKLEDLAGRVKYYNKDDFKS